MSMTRQSYYVTEYDLYKALLLERLKVGYSYVNQVALTKTVQL